MRSVRIFALLGVVAAAAIVISSAGAGPTRGRTAIRIDLSSTASISKYLRSIGVNPRGVVVQRGPRNYAGANCPGKRWNCTKARRVVQIATSTYDNQFVCSESNAPAPEGPPATDSPNTCLVVQTSESSDNVALCREVSGSSSVAQTCTIIQQNSTGANRARVHQSAAQDVDSVASATQRIEVTQTNGSGANSLKVVQKAGQSADTFADVASQDLSTDQKWHVTQNADSGAQLIKVIQSANQDAQADDVSGGTQHVAASLIGDIEEQLSSGVSTVDVTQNENQNEQAPAGVGQTVVGPLNCCAGGSGHQGTNPNDDYEVDQSSVQHTSSQSGGLTEDMNIFCSSTGNCDGEQNVNENGSTAANSCSSIGSLCEATLHCTNGDCTPFSCADGSCNEEEGPSILLGSTQGAPTTDYNPAGLAEAFQTTAGDSGSVDTLNVFVDSASTATTLIAGVYSDYGGHPGSLLGTGTLNSPTPGAWNAVTLGSPASVTSGSTYWIAILGPSGAGTLRFRDHCCGGGSPSEVSKQTALSALPATWATGTRYNDGALGAYGTP
jgi:hypothetical protein